MSSSLNQDVKIIEADTVEFKSPFIPQEIKLKNNSTNHGLKFESNVKVGNDFNFSLGAWKIEHSADVLYFYKNDQLKMKLE